MDEKKARVPIIVLAGLLAVAIGVIVFLVTGGQEKVVPKDDTVAVPNVTMADEKDVEKLLTHAGLKLGLTTEENSEDVPEHHVISQNPAAETKVQKGSAVDVVVSKGKTKPAQVAVPDLKGKSQEEAEKALTDVKLVPVPGNPEYSDEVDPGKVCKQSVPAGKVLDEGSQVVFSVSLGKETVAVPDVTGKPIDQARETLNKAGLGTDTTSAYSDKVAKDVVISQSVAKETKVVKGTVVTLQVSLGVKPKAKVKVPNILTYSLDEAKAALDSAGLMYRYTGDADGTVSSVKPAPGTEVEQGSTVNFTLQHHATLVAVPDVAGMSGVEAKAAIEQVGLKLDYDENDPDRTLAGTDPVASTMVDVGTVIKAVYAPQPTPEPGGWTTYTHAKSHVTSAEKNIFKRAVSASAENSDDVTAANSKPIAVIATQMTAGTNYAYLGYKGDSWCIYEISETADGDASLVSARTIDVANVKTTGDNTGTLVGGWVASGAEAGGLAPQDLADAFNAASSAWTGVGLNPIALLGQQVISGTDYKILCASASVTSDSREGLCVVTLHVDPNGEANLSNVSTLDLAGYLG